MIDTEQQEINFYKNGAAEDVLKRFVFSKEEEKLVRNAIRTAQRPNPRMALIHQADELLKEVAKTRQPIEPTEKTKVSPADMASFEMMTLNTNKRKEKLEAEENIPRFFGFKSKYGILVVILITAGMIAVEYFRTKPINDTIQKQENLINGIAN